MTPAYALTQLLKLGALSFEDIVKYTGWTESKARETVKTLKAAGEIERQLKPSRYAVPAMPKPQRSTAIQRLQPTMPNVWGDWHSIITTHADRSRGQNAAFKSMVSRLCEVRPQRNRAATAGEGVTL
jgi:DNA-binding transcriptional regulator PaaX